MTEPTVRAEREMEPFDTLMHRGGDDPRSRSTMLGVFVLDEAPDWDRLVRSMERVTRLAVPLRQRVVEPTIPVTMPRWVTDPDFDLSHHLRRVRLPGPGTIRDLLDFIEPLAMSPLDKARPLWEFTLVEGLDDGRAAWITKLSHAVTDGVGGDAIARLIYDLEPDSPQPPMPPVPAPGELTPNELSRRALSQAPITGLAMVRRAARTGARLVEKTLRQPAKATTEAVAFARSLGRTMAGPPSEPSPLLRQRSIRRRLEILEVDLDELKSASRAAGGSLNDGYLAAVCGGVRRYHERLGVPIESLPMAVPISIRKGDDPHGGNRWAGVRIGPPVGVTDPAERIERIHQQMTEARAEPALDAMGLIAPVAALLPAWLIAAASEGREMAVDLQVSNVPGSPFPLYFCGAKVHQTFGFGPVPGAAAMITMYSYAGTCEIGTNLDPAAITDPALFSECLAEGFDEVLALGQPKKGRRRATPKKPR